MRRTVLAGAPFCIAGVVMVARPSFLFGDGSKSSSTVGLLVAMAQTTFSALVKIIVRELRTTEQTNVRDPVDHSATLCSQETCPVN